jgi:hypothetical protein
MTSVQTPRTNRDLKGASARMATVTVLGAMLSASPAAAQTTNTQQPVRRPTVPVPVPQKPVAAAQNNNLLNPFAGLNNNAAGRTAPALSAQAQKFLNPGANTNVGNNTAVNNTTAASKNPLASLFNKASTGSNRPSTSNNLSSLQKPVITGPQVPAKSVPGLPAPRGAKEMQGNNGSIIRTAADGSVLDVRNPSKGMVIHHAIDGSRRVMVQNADRSRAYIPAKGIAYVQHPYNFRGQQLDHRTFVVQGQLVHQIYRPYTYRGTNLDVYATSRYYAPNFYQWVGTKVAAPQKFNWPYNSSTPWYGHYQGFFTPETSYQSPAQWLTDYVLAATLFVAYTTKGQASDPPPANTAPVTPQVKEMLTAEMERQVKQEAAEAADNTQNRTPQPGAGSVVQELSDHETHVFVVSSDLDLVDPSGRRCAMSEGDVVQVTSGPQGESSAVQAVVLVSKGGVECTKAARVEIALNDVQEMQNHMRAVMDQGMATTPAANMSKPVTPAFAAAAPPADQNATQEIEQQTQIAAAADG